MLVTKPKAIKLLEQVVDEVGADKVAEYCTYAEKPVACTQFSDRPNCIVGQVLYRLDPAIIERINDEGANLIGADTILVASRIVGEVKFSKPAIDLLNVAQILQDGRDFDGEFGGSNMKMPWGEVLEKVRAL